MLEDGQWGIGDVTGVRRKAGGVPAVMGADPGDLVHTPLRPAWGSCPFSEGNDRN